MEVLPVISFKDGPADGMEFNLRRTPLFMRITRDQDTAKVDALDLLDDTPRDDEDIFVYQRIGEYGHACARGSSGQSGWFATYVWRSEVDGSLLRDSVMWQNWAVSADPFAMGPPA